MKAETQHGGSLPAQNALAERRGQAEAAQPGEGGLRVRSGRAAGDPEAERRPREGRGRLRVGEAPAEHGGEGRAQVVEATANVEITSITGTFQFDEKGDNINAKAYAYEIVDGYPGKLVGELTGA